MWSGVTLCTYNTFYVCGDQNKNKSEDVTILYIVVYLFLGQTLISRDKLELPHTRVIHTSPRLFTATVGRTVELRDPLQLRLQHPFIMSRKGGVHLVHNNFVYRSNMKRQGVEQNKIYWECIHNRVHKCRGRVKSIANQLFVTNSKR